MISRISFAAVLLAAYVLNGGNHVRAHEEDMQSEIALFNEYMNISNIISSDGGFELLPDDHDIGFGWPTPDPAESAAAIKLILEDDDAFKSANAKAAKASIPRIVQPVSFVNFHKRDGTGKRSYAEFKAQVDQLNKAYSGAEARSARYGSARDTNIRFELAGIRYVANDDFFNYCTLPSIIAKSRPKYMMKGSRHLNVYVCWCENNLGMAWLPYDSWFRQNTGEDHYAHGTIIHHDLLPGNKFKKGLWSKGNILVHEVGHFYGLKHPYEGGCAGTEAKSDQIADTPRMSGNPLADCKALGARDSCKGHKGKDDLGNYMIATADSCRNHFTPGQVNFMQSTIRKYKPTLLKNPLPDCVASIDSSDASPDLQPCLAGTVKKVNGRDWCRTNPDDSSQWAWACCPSGNNWANDKCRQGTPNLSSRKVASPARARLMEESAGEDAITEPSTDSDDTNATDAPEAVADELATVEELIEGSEASSQEAKNLRL